MKKKVAASSITDHVQTVEKVSVDALYPHPMNPNVGDVDAIAASILANGLYRPIVAQRSTSRVLAGHHTLEAMRQLGEREISVTWADVDDITALNILLSDNHTAEKAHRDDEKLAQVLSYLETQTGLAGSSYDSEDLGIILARLDAPAPKEAPQEFNSFDENISTEHQCPKCGYEWSGKTR